MEEPKAGKQQTVDSGPDVLVAEANQVTMVHTSQSGEHLEPLPVLQLEEGQPNKGNAGADVWHLILRKHEASAQSQEAPMQR